MRAGEHTPWRRTANSTRGKAVFVSPTAASMEHAKWSARLEQRALHAGYVAVIDGEVIEPKTAAVRDAIAKTGGAA